MESVTTSEAVPPKVPRAVWWVVGLLALSAVINYVDRQATNVISPLLIETFRLTDAQWGWVNAVFALTYVFTSTLGGAWVDRVGVRKGLLISTIFWTLAAAGHSLAAGFYGLCFWRAMLAVGEGPGGAALLKGVRQSLPTRFQDTGTGLVGAGTLMGALLAPLLVPTLAARYGWQAAFIMTAVLGVLWLPAWLFVSRQPGINLEPMPSGPKKAAPGIDFRSPSTWAIMVAIFFTIPPTVFTLSFLARYLSVTYGLPVPELAKLQWQPYLAMDLGQVVAAIVLPLLMRRGLSALAARRLVMVVGFCGSTLMILVAFAPTLGAAMGWLNISRFLFQFAYVALQAYAISSVTGEQAGRMTGLMNATFGACNFVFSPLIGYLADLFHHDYRPVLLMVSLSPLLGLTGWLVLSRIAARQAANPA